MPISPDHMKLPLTSDGYLYHRRQGCADDNLSSMAFLVFLFSSAVRAGIPTVGIILAFLVGAFKILSLRNYVFVFLYL